MICDRCGAEVQIGDWPCNPEKGRGHERALNVPIFVPYFDIGLGEHVESIGHRLSLMRKHGLVDRPKLTAGDMSARRDRIEQQKREAGG